MTNEPLQKDSLAREVARTEFQRPVVLRAGAGTGKTAALVARVVSWSIGSGWAASRAALGADATDERVARRTLSRVVAITFTEAAAAEMAERIAEALDALKSLAAVTGLPVEGLDTQAQHRAKVLLGAVDQMEVRTFHSWCRNLLAQFPLEAQLHPDFEVDADGEATQRLVRKIVEAGLERMLVSERAPMLLALIENEIGPAAIEEAVLSLAIADVDGGVVSNNVFDNSTLELMLRRLWMSIDEVIHCVGERLEDVSAAKNGRLLLNRLTELRDDIQKSSGPGLEEVQEQIADLLPRNLRNHLTDKWGKSACGKAEGNALSDVSVKLERYAGELGLQIDCVGILDPPLYSALQVIVSEMLIEVREEQRKNGIIGFTGLLTRAADLLSRPGIAQQIQLGLDQLLVDEFQDTDPRQCDIVRAIALNGPLERRPGLFIVGDPKQSIYGWRNADLRAYESFTEEMRKADAVEHGLVQNFRSVAPILKEVDRCMAGLMLAEAGVQPEYEQLVAARGGDSLRPAVEYWVSWEWDDDVPNQSTKAVPARVLEARALAADLARLKNEGVPMDSVGVLFRSTGDLDTYQSALRDAGVPYEVTRDKSYFRRREIVDAAALLRSLLDPMDSIALVTLLRSPMACLPDASFVPLWAEAFPGHWAKLGSADVAITECIEAIGRAVPYVQAAEVDVDGLSELRVWSSRLEELIRYTHTLRASFVEIPFDDWITEVRNCFLPDVVGATAYQGAYRVANLEQFFRQVVGRMANTSGDLSDLLRFLRDAISTQKDAEEARPSDAGPAVQLLTIHKSKGLAFSHTYVVDLHHQFPNTKRGQGTIASVDGGIQLAGLVPPMFDQVWSRQRQVERAERIRLLYVAMTRARDRLVLMGAWPADLRGSARPRNMLDYWGCKEDGCAHPADIASRLSGDGTVRDEGGVRWVFPGRFPITDRGMDSHDVPPGVPPKCVSVERKEKARHRQAQAWTQGPSSATENSDTTGMSGGGVGRENALLAGTAIHLLMQWLPDEGCTKLGVTAEKMEAALIEAAEGRPVTDGARSRANDLRMAVQHGSLLKQYESLEILGKELPMMLASSAEGPVGAWVGSIDMLYRDPATGLPVIVDYKTDFVGRRDVEAVAAHHAEQGRLYTQAVQTALGLSEPPRFEIWMLEEDERVTVS
jgi:ATP-dependent helicase/nuclease subunit A